MGLTDRSPVVAADGRNTVGDQLTSTRRARGACLAAVLAVLAVLGGVVLSVSSAQCSQNCQAAVVQPSLTASQPPAPAPAAVWISPVGGSTEVNPAGRVLVVAAAGTLTDVTMVNDDGEKIPGVLARDNRSWRPAEELGYGRKYTMTVAARGVAGMPSRQTSSFKTLSPDNLAEVYFETTAGNLLADGGTFGVGNVVSARFDTPITDRAAAQRHLRVITDPPVFGSWNWIDDQTAHWRPEKYFAPGTSVKVTADIYGVPLGDGLRAG